MKALASTVVIAALTACGGGGDPVENTAAQLENAAEQSDPAAAAVLNNMAEQVIEQNSTAPAQGALEEAGNAQLQTPAPSPPQPPRPGLRAPERSDPLPRQKEQPVRVE